MRENRNLNGGYSVSTRVPHDFHSLLFLESKAQHKQRNLRLVLSNNEQLHEDNLHTKSDLGSLASTHIHPRLVLFHHLNERKTCFLRPCSLCDRSKSIVFVAQSLQDSTTLYSEVPDKDCANNRDYIKARTLIIPLPTVSTFRQHSSTIRSRDT